MDNYINNTIYIYIYISNNTRYFIDVLAGCRGSQVDMAPPHSVILTCESVCESTQ